MADEKPGVKLEVQATNSAIAPRPVGLGSRPDITYVQSQFLPWESYPARGPGCERRKLSQDSVTGAETFVMKLAPGYKLDGPVLLESDLELFVIYGEVEINGNRYHRDCYSVHPAGYAHNSFTSPRGATVIMITMGGPDIIYRGRPKVQYRADRLVEFIDTWKMDWKAGAPRAIFPAQPQQPPPPIDSPGPPPDDFSKVLWEDPDTKGHTFLWAAVPHLPSYNRYSHSIDFEIFVLQGDYTLADSGKMVAGAYNFWKAYVDHGPYSTEYGFYNLHKHYGIVQNYHEPLKFPATFDPPHHPSLPPELEKYGKAFDLPKWWD